MPHHIWDTLCLALPYGGHHKSRYREEGELVGAGTVVRAVGSVVKKLSVHGSGGVAVRGRE